MQNDHDLFNTVLHSTVQVRVESIEPLKQSMGSLTALFTGSYDEPVSDYLRNNFISICGNDEEEYNSVMQRDAYKNANYGDIYTFDREDDLVKNRSYAFMIMPKMVGIGYDQEILLLQDCCKKVIDFAEAEGHKSIDFLLFPDETTRLPLAVKFFVMKEILLDLTERSKRKSCIKRIFIYIDPQKVMPYSRSVNHDPKDFDQPLFYQGYEDITMLIIKQRNELEWLIQFEGSLEELLRTWETKKPHFLPEITMFRKITKRFPDFINKQREAKSIQEELMQRYTKYIEENPDKSAKDFGLTIIDNYYKKWTEEMERLRTEQPIEFAERYGKKNYIGILEELAAYKRDKLPIDLGDKKPRSCSRDMLISLAVAMNLDERDRKTFISSMDIGKIYPFGTREVNIEECIKTLRNIYKPTLLNTVRLSDIKDMIDDMEHDFEGFRENYNFY